ncbi:MAG: bifunctional oligoribonuclease and phosphatase NrnA, partial [Thermoleophilaceae bacterium]|nr:bifunctional oligoribonuclease and phosphatase NrnA [Thermoleophilaceae bacterium]
MKLDVTTAREEATAREEVLEELRLGHKFLLTTHENPDGDALGSLLAFDEMMRSLGKDTIMFMSASNFPLPHEYQHLPLERVQNEPPADMEERTAVFLDCGNIDRMPVDFLQRDGQHILNIDHHHDNTQFGTVNLVVGDASCTAEILWELASALDIELTRSMAEALYIALITDTGRFMYENTGARAHLMAAELIDAGVDVAGVYRQLYQDLPFPRLQLLARALGRVQRLDDGRLTVAHLSRADFGETGAIESDSEGVVDHLRAVEHTKVAVLIRELLDRDGRKVSLRATDGSVDVSVIARSLGGGGHRQAAGASTELPLDEMIEQIRAAVAAQL